MNSWKKNKKPWEGIMGSNEMDKPQWWIMCLNWNRGNLIILCLIYLFKGLFIYFVGENRRGRGRRREPWRGLPAEHPSWPGDWSQDPKIMTWAEIKSGMLSQLSHSATPLFFFYSNKINVQCYISFKCTIGWLNTVHYSELILISRPSLSPISPSCALNFYL